VSSEECGKLVKKFNAFSNRLDVCAHYAQAVWKTAKYLLNVDSIPPRK